MQIPVKLYDEPVLLWTWHYITIKFQQAVGIMFILSFFP